MLTFYILNVGHGLSVVIEYSREHNSVYGVVDSNVGAGGTPQALLKLRELGATSLSFLCLTHPHRDHFPAQIKLSEPLVGLSELGSTAANAVARAVARAVYEAKALPFPGALPSWRDRFAPHSSH